ncbi:MAG: serine/threonine protein kinase, partial [Cytophagaceae bacterium]|nr:serine/threonine protein kinase [Gemmatimonadaceae bacterium]
MTSHDSGTGGLTPEQWGRLEEVLAAAIELPPEERAALIERACAGDARLRAEVESLLVAHEKPGVLDVPISRRNSSPGVHGGGFAPGSVVAHYEIGELLGSGGMGVVYRARDLRLERTVALKFLPTLLSADAHAKRRFLVEARAAAALEHVHVCTIHEIGETDEGQLFIAMAFIEGESLRRLIDRGALTVSRAVTIARQLASALQAAHEHGIVHRDVKPANVMLTRDGSVKLVDFGVAKLEGSTLTGAGGTPGTMSYMSPEQVRGEEVDCRTDVWATGVVLFEMLAGSRPFIGDTDAATLHAITAAEPKQLRALRANAPQGLERVVARALDKVRERRFPSAAALEAALESVETAMSAPPRR